MSAIAEDGLVFFGFFFVFFFLTELNLADGAPFCLYTHMVQIRD